MLSRKEINLLFRYETIDGSTNDQSLEAILNLEYDSTRLSHCITWRQLSGYSHLQKIISRDKIVSLEPKQLHCASGEMLISTRISIAWAPSFKQNEPTNTLVLTGKIYFVDQRLDLLQTSDQRSENDDDISNLTVSWAFAGTRSSSPIPGKPGHSKCQWKHLVTSRDAIAEAPDEGIMQPHPDFPDDPEIALETGSMANPDTGVETEYQEVWRDSIPEQGCRVEFWEYGDDDKKGSVERGMVGIVGDLAIGVGRADGGKFWTWRAAKVAKEVGWKMLFEVGDKRRGYELLGLEKVSEGIKIGDNLATEGGADEPSRDERGDREITWVCKESWTI